MKKALIAVGVAAVLGLVLWASLRGSGDETGERVYAEPAARRDVVQVVKASGEIEARVSVDLSSHVVAKIDRLYVAEGDRVEAGQRFAELEKQAFQAAAESWRAQLRQAETGVRQAEVDLADADVKLTRAHRLRDEGITSGEELEGAELRRQSAALRLREAGDQVANTRANLSRALDELGKTTLYSPISGRVVDLNAEEGEVVVSGMMNNPASKIATIADLSELLARLDVDENEVVDVALGQAVEVTVDAIGDRTYRARVVEVGSSGYTRPGQGDVKFFKVEALLEEADARLRPGMSLRADVEVAAHPDALAVPVQAVVERPRGGDASAAEDGATDERTGEGDADTVDVVYVVADGVAARREVTTGISTVTDVEILSGLEPGEEVVTGPYRALRDLEDGDAVRVVDQNDDEKKAKDSDD